MQPYIKIYLEYFDYIHPAEVICEACGAQSSDIHHIHGRGKGKDVIENLIALCRTCHERAHGTKHWVPPDEMQLIHNYFLNGTRKKFLG